MEPSAKNLVSPVEIGSWEAAGLVIKSEDYFAETSLSGKIGKIRVKTKKVKSKSGQTFNSLVA